MHVYKYRYNDIGCLDNNQFCSGIFYCQGVQTWLDVIAGENLIH